MSQPVSGKSLKVRIAVVLGVLLLSSAVIFVPFVGFLTILGPLVAGFVFIRIGPYMSMGRAVGLSALVVGLATVLLFIIFWTVTFLVNVSGDLDNELEGRFEDLAYGAIYVLVLIAGVIGAGFGGVVLGAIGGLIGAATLGQPPAQAAGQQFASKPVEPADPNDPWA